MNLRHAGVYVGRRIEKAKKATLSQVEALAAKLEPNLAAKILDALYAQQSEVSLESLVKALKTGDVGMVLNLLSIEAIEGVQEGVNATTWAAGGVVAGEVSRLTGTTFRFNQLNPRLIEYLQSYSLKLIHGINQQTRDGVREYLVDGMTSGANPRTTAREIRQIVGLTPRQARAVKNYRRELETFHLKRSAGAYGLGNKIDRAPGGAQVFKPDEDGTPKDGIDLRRLRDLRYDGQLKAAMKTGKAIPSAKVDEMVDAYARKYRKFRSETIARTEALRATNVGVQDAWRQAIESGKTKEELVRRQWIVARDERLCEECGPVPGMNPKRGVKFGQPFSTPSGPVMLPPLHPNCRCTVWIRPFEPEQLADGK